MKKINEEETRGGTKKKNWAGKCILMIRGQWNKLCIWDDAWITKINSPIDGEKKRGKKREDPGKTFLAPKPHLPNSGCLDCAILETLLEICIPDNTCRKWSDDSAKIWNLLLVRSVKTWFSQQQ